MTSAMEPAQAINGAALETLGDLYLRVERKHDRAGVLASRTTDRWLDVPDWRFHRQVIRIALFLRERAGVKPGESVAIVSPLRAESIVADWATVLDGAVAVGVDPGLGKEVILSALAETRPRVVFVATAEDKDWLVGLNGDLRSVETIVVFEGLPPSRVDASADAAGVARGSFWSSVLDLGGTLDTAERAQAFRARARELRPAMPALAHLERSLDGSTRWRRLTHGGVVEELGSFWSRTPPRKGDVAYVAASGSWSSRLAGYAFPGDGLTRLALGRAGREVDDIRELHPQLVVAPHEIVERALPWGERARSKPEAPQRSAARAWLDPATFLTPLRKRLLGETSPAPVATDERFREVVDFH